MLEYKGYLGEGIYDGGVLHGRVINSGSYPIANCEATDVEGLEREFRISIDEYLASCEEHGVEPVKPFSGKVYLRMSSELHQRVMLAAVEEGMSLNAWGRHALEKAVSRGAKLGAVTDARGQAADA